MSDDLFLYVGEKNISSWSMRAFVALAAKGLRFEERTIELRRDKDRSQRRRVSPTGKVPVLHHGDLVIPDSLAIIEYVEEAFPAPGHPALWPADRARRARARWMAAAMHSGFMALRQGMSFNLCFVPKPPLPPPDALAEAAEMLALFEETLKRTEGAGRKDGGPFLFGAFGGADAMFAPAIVRLTSFRVPTAATPKAADYMEAVLAHPAVKRWMDAARALPPAETY